MQKSVRSYYTFRSIPFRTALIFFVVGSRKHLKFFERCIFEDLFSLHDGPRRICNKRDILKVT